MKTVVPNFKFVTLVWKSITGMSLIITFFLTLCIFNLKIEINNNHTYVYCPEKNTTIASTADGDCSHKIKRRLLLGRKVMTNLDSIFKSRDITLPTKVRLVKAMVFPVVMYECESWAER